MIFSQTTYPKTFINNSDTLILITPIQLRHTNYIFAEPNKFKQELIQKNKKLELYQEYTNNLLQINSSLKEEVIHYKKRDSIHIANWVQCERNVTQLNKKLNNYKAATYIGISTTVGLIVGLVLWKQIK